jgi:hypothetical protein
MHETQKFFMFQYQSNGQKAGKDYDFIQSSKLLGTGSKRQRQHVFSHVWKVKPKDKHIHKNKHDRYTSSYVEHACNSGSILWNLGKEGKEKRMIEYQQYHKT